MLPSLGLQYVLYGIVLILPYILKSKRTIVLIYTGRILGRTVNLEFARCSLSGGLFDRGSGAFEPRIARVAIALEHFCLSGRDDPVGG